MMDADRFRTAFVPHDLKTPLNRTDNGLLAGYSVAVKDMFDIAGERVSGGSPAWLEAHPPAERNSAVVDKILAAGGTIVGKTVCDEFFYSVTGTNFHYGTPLNPRAPARIPGGSSSGSASAVSSGTCDIAIGSDTGGSVRIPAALCGVYGIRVTRGRMDMSGAMSMAPSFDAGGWFAATPGVFAQAGKVLLDDFGKYTDEIAQVKMATDAFAIADKRIGTVTHRFLRSVASLLPPSGDIVIAGDDIDKWREAMRITQAFEVWKSFGTVIDNTTPTFGPGVAERMAIAAAVSEKEMRDQAGVLAAARRRMDEVTSDGTIIVLPTSAVIAPLLESTPAQFEEYRVRTMRLVCMASISGLPQVTIPMGTIDGAPVGLSFLGWRNGEEALLKLVGRLAPYVGIAA